MPRVPLNGVPYANRSLIASAQRAINLYPELNNNPQAPTPITEYQFPGTVLFGTPTNPGINRCTYRTSIGTTYVVVGPTVYLLQVSGAMVFIGSIPDRASQVYMADNGLAVVLVDGVEGWAIDMSTNAFGQIIDPAFYGADYVVFLDTFFAFNRPDTNQFYISISMASYAELTGGTAFDPLDIAAKSGSADPIVAIATVHKELWLIGELTTEVWIGTGAADFYFQAVQGAYIEHGCGAPYSVANQDVVLFWIMQDKQGKNIILKGQGYEVSEISTPYIVDQLNSYESVADAIGMCFQIEGHAFYLLQFPTANITWCFSLKINRWFRLGKWNIETNQFDRYRANCCMFAFGKNLIGDYSTGKVYELDPDVFTDNDEPIMWERQFMHMIGGENQRNIYLNLDADFETGNSTQENEDEAAPQVFLSWSDDRGKSFGFPVPQSLGKQGEYYTTLSWNRLGMARDRVFKLQWSAPVYAPFNGVFVQSKPART